MESTASPNNRGTQNTRRGRWSAKGQIYHAICTTQKRAPVFDDFLNGRCIVRALARLEEVGYTRTFAFVIMPDHLHWLLQLRDDASLSIVIGNAKSYSARLVNSRTKKNGAVWQRGFFDHAIRQEENLVSVARYIVANPLRAGLVDSIGDYALWDSVWMT